MGTAGAAAAEDGAAQKGAETKAPAAQTAGAGLEPLKFLARTISRADGERCPMHPTCSAYAVQAFERKGFFWGWILTCDRLLRCGRDELHLAPAVIVNGVRKCSDPLEDDMMPTYR